MTQLDLEDASRIDEILSQIHQKLNSSEQLSAAVKYKLTEKGQNERSRFSKLLNYEGPEEATLELLRREKERWFNRPATFWLKGVPTFPSLHERQAHIVGIYLQAERVDA
ncbi:hypothetical protein LTR13_008203 [Exophiala sideris]|nr:hypothetical protein LTR13_008203 [Exophiala sideris]KAK5176415.1 hypothetical protein LTR44_011037 [Eurotiomycetes sp. CCFEE 6388]